MVIVPLEGVSYNFGDVQKELNKIYGPLGIEWRVKTDSVFRSMEWDLVDNDILDAEESQSFSMYSPEMRALNRLYKEQRGVDSKTMYMFVVKEINGKRGGLLGDMPLSSQFGYLAASNDAKLAAKTIAHELGHGMFYLRHTFSQYKLAERSTDNLMDYKPEGTQLFKKQWDEIFDPRRPWFAWRQDEEEGAMEIPRGVRGLLAQLEKIRYGYAFNQSLKFYSGVNHANNIKLTENNTLSYAAVIGREYEFDMNPRRDYSPPPEQVKKSWDTQEFTYFNFRIPSSFTKNALETKVNPIDRTKLEEYVFIDQETWISQTSELINNTNRDYVLERFSCYPDISYNSFTAQQRIELLKKLASGSMTEMGVVNQEIMALRILSTTPKNQIGELFVGLETGTLLKDLAYRIDNVFGADNYTKFIFELLILFYSQSKDEINSKSNNGKSLTWHKGGDFNVDPLAERRTLIDYKTGFLSNGRVYFEGTIKQVRPPSQQLYEIKIPLEEMSAFSVINVHFSSSPSFLNIQKDAVLPVPAFFFKWVNDEHISRVVKEGTTLALTMASFAFGVGEFMTATTLLRQTIAIIGLSKQIADVCFKTPVIKNKLSEILGERNLIIEHWEHISLILSITIIDLKLLDNAPVLFTAFADSWGLVKQDNSAWEKINQSLTPDEITSIEFFVKTIKEYMP